MNGCQKSGYYSGVVVVVFISATAKLRYGISVSYIKTCYNVKDKRCFTVQISLFDVKGFVEFGKFSVYVIHIVT